jgi:hypothetical protein
MKANSDVTKLKMDIIRLSESALLNTTAPFLITEFSHQEAIYVEIWAYEHSS